MSQKIVKLDFIGTKCFLKILYRNVLHEEKENEASAKIKIPEKINEKNSLEEVNNSIRNLCVEGVGRCKSFTYL